MNNSKVWTEDRQNAIKQMSNEEMIMVLKGLMNTEYFIAILKYTQDRLGLIQNNFMGMNPMTQQYDMARAQGIMAGVGDFSVFYENLLNTDETSENL